MHILETERLTFRRLAITDLDALQALYADPDIRRYFPEGPLTREQTREELEWFANGGDPKFPDLGLWATIHRPTRTFIGRCGLLPWTIEGVQEVEVAYLLDKRFWGQGLGTEAASALVQYGFERLGLFRLIALIDSANTASVRTAERAGLSFERHIDFNGPCSLYAVEQR